jgi:protocatechuate 3,4-dioxygenase beta subunit
MAFSTRRRFLAELAGFSGVVAIAQLDAQRGLDQFVVPSPGCTDADLTPAVKDSTGFKPGSPARTSFVETGVTGSKIVIAGFVIGLKCGRVKGARLDFWHADPRGVVDERGFRFRGHQLTDGEGRYRLETLMPGAAANRAPSLGVRLTPPEQPPITTRLFFPDEANNTRDPQFAPKLVMKRAAGTFTFDFILNL